MQPRGLRQRAAGAACAAAILAVSGCQQGGGNPLEGNEQIVGGVVGAGLGALLGSQFGSGRGQLAATAIGTLAGAYLGSQLAARLSREDQEQHTAAVEEALDEPPEAEPTVWRNPASGNGGAVTAGEPVVVPAGSAGEERTCRPIVQTITLADGTSEETEAMACQGQDGNWTIEA